MSAKGSLFFGLAGVAYTRTTSMSCTTIPTRQLFHCFLLRLIYLFISSQRTEILVSLSLSLSRCSTTYEIVILLFSALFHCLLAPRGQYSPYTSRRPLFHPLFIFLLVHMVTFGDGKRFLSRLRSKVLTRTTQWRTNWVAQRKRNGETHHHTPKKLIRKLLLQLSVAICSVCIERCGWWDETQRDDDNNINRYLSCEKGKIVCLHLKAFCWATSQTGENTYDPKLFVLSHPLMRRCLRFLFSIFFSYFIYHTDAAADLHTFFLFFDFWSSDHRRHDVPPAAKVVNCFYYRFN